MQHSVGYDKVITYNELGEMWDVIWFLENIVVFTRWIKVDHINLDPDWDLNWVSPDPSHTCLQQH
jgi:hypothetical protein